MQSIARTTLNAGVHHRTQQRLHFRLWLQKTLMNIVF